MSDNFDIQDIYCCYCGRTFEGGRKYTVDHLVPVSKGGRNSNYNKRPCCSMCNTQKGNMDIIQYVEYIESLVVKSYGGNQGKNLSIKLENAKYIEEYVLSAGDKLYKKQEDYLKFKRKYKQYINE